MSKHWSERIEDTGNVDGPDIAAKISIAISLKRIADALNSTNAYGEIGFDALSGAILRGLRGQS